MLQGLPQLSKDGLEGLNHFLSLNLGFSEPEFQVERLGGCPVLKYEGPGPTTPGHGLLPTDDFAGRNLPAGDPLDQGDHFRAVSLPNYL